MSVTAIKWHPKPKRVDADPGATLTLDRSAWEQAGATFTPTDDGNGETPGLATAAVKTPAGPVQIGVVDYDEPSTYLLVPGAGPQRLSTTVAVLETLEAAGTLQIQKDLLDLADVAPPPTLEERVADLERALAETQHDSAKAPPASLVHSVSEKTLKQRPKGTKVVTAKHHGSITRKSPVTGTVKWFSGDKGFGFIKPDDGDKDIFIGHLKGHYKALPTGALVNLKTLDLYDVDVLIGSDRHQPATPRGSKRSTKRRAAKAAKKT